MSNDDQIATVTAIVLNTMMGWGGISCAGMDDLAKRIAEKVLASNCLLAKTVNDTIYAVGAPLGSDAYFAIRRQCCDVLYPMANEKPDNAAKE